MQLSDFTIRILLLFFPGVICAILVDNLTIHEKRSIGFFLIHSFVYGIFSYFFLSVLPPFCGIVGSCFKYFQNHEVIFFNALVDSRLKINWKEILAASLMAIILGFFFSVMITQEILHRIARFLKVTQKLGKLDVWHHTFDASRDQWVRIRDIANDLIFEGWIRNYSDSSSRPELFVQDVKVFVNKTGEYLYDVPALYFSRDQKDVTIEFPTYGVPIPKKGD